MPIEYDKKNLIQSQSYHGNAQVITQILKN